MVDEQAADYVQRIKEADHLVLVFSIWWELMSAMTKGFIDKIIFQGSTYTYTKSGYGMNTMLDNLQSATVITTMNTPRVLYKSLVKGTFKKSGIKNVKWVSFDMVKASKPEKRHKWLDKVAKLNK